MLTSKTYKEQQLTAQVGSHFGPCDLVEGQHFPLVNRNCFFSPMIGISKSYSIGNYLNSLQPLSFEESAPLRMTISWPSSRRQVTRG